PAIIAVDAISDREYTGTVTNIDTIGANNQGVITYNVIIKITNTDDQLRAQMTVDVDIQVAQVQDVLSVPNGAIKPYQGARAVQVIDPETKLATYVPVETGIKGPQYTQILSGITQGTQVITGVKN